MATFTKVVVTEVNPNLAYKLNDSMAVAFGVAFVQLRATLEKTVNVILLPGPVLLGDHNFRLSGDGDGWGANAALMYKAAPNVNVGLSYRSRVKIDVDGREQHVVNGMEELLWWENLKGILIEVNNDVTPRGGFHYGT